MTGINIADPTASTTEGQDLLYAPESIKQEQDMDQDASSTTQEQHMVQDLWRVTRQDMGQDASTTTQGQHLVQDEWSAADQDIDQDTSCSEGPGASISDKPDMFEDALSSTDMVSEAREEADTQEVRLSEFE